MEHERKLPKSHAFSNKKNPDVFKNKQFSVFIDENSNKDITGNYRLEPTLDLITKLCGKYCTTGIISNDTEAPLNPMNIKLTCELITDNTEQKTTKSNFMKTFFPQSDNFTQVTNLNNSVHNREGDDQSGASTEQDNEDMQ